MALLSLQNRISNMAPPWLHGIWKVQLLRLKAFHHILTQFLVSTMTEIRVSLPSKDYAPAWCRKGGGLKPKVDENLLRILGAKHADIWARGDIYPQEPITGQFPKFDSVSGLVKFSCEGRSGLLGYCENMNNYIQQLCFRICESHTAIKEKDKELSTLGEQHKQLASRVIKLEHKLSNLQQENSLQTFVINQTNRELRSSISMCRKEECKVKTLEKRLQRLKMTPLGLRERNRKRKPIESLNPTCGAARRRIYAIKSVLNTKKEKNNVRGNIGKLVKSIATKDEVLAMLNDPTNSSLRRGIVEMVLNEIYSKIDANEVQAHCDSSGISREAYRVLFKSFQDALKLLGTKKVVAPRPYALRLIRRRRNAAIDDVLGGMHSLESGCPFNKSTKKNNACESVGLNENNNVWFNMEALLKFMVIFYQIHEAEVQGTIEICLKLDEMELTNKKKFERVSMVLMNYALRSDYEKRGWKPKKGEKPRDPEWFSVQSEEHTWWLGMFQVQKENYSILKWVFDQTELPRLIAFYESGGLLKVDGHGSFKIRFHLASDLKTEKAMYNISNTPLQTHSNCIYCMYKLKEQKRGRSLSTLNCNQELPPNRDQKDPNFNAILPIPLDRVHFCTLHALVRIVEKMIHHSCCFVWNIKGEKDRTEGIERVEKVLSEAGLHGGFVTLEKDEKKSTKSSVPAKVSLGGEKARRFLKSIDPKRKGMFEFGKKLVQAEKDRTDRAQSTIKKLEAWNAFSDVNGLLQKHSFNSDDANAFKDRVSKFTKAYIAAWGESEVSHYIHILHAHGPWFAKTYGSLAVWNTQGMEKSHKQAKTAFHRATQRGGSRLTSKPLYQMNQWFYRRLIARHESNVRRRANPVVDKAIIELSKKRKREAWMKSNGKATQMEWRLRRRRVGSSWKLK